MRFFTALLLSLIAVTSSCFAQEEKDNKPAVALFPGLLVWIVCASMPTPRICVGSGQMHIFFLPVFHLGYCFFVYLGTGLLALVASNPGKA